MKEFLIHIIIFIICLYPYAVHSEVTLTNTKVLLHSEYASYNKVYRSKEYLDNNSTFFPVPMTNIGGEFSNKYSDGYITGFGTAWTEIDGGEVYNLNQYEIQPYTSILVPYVFIGKDMYFLEIDLGLSYYLTFQNYEYRYYYSPDGTQTKRKRGITNLRRDDSYVLVNFMLRFLPESGYHFKLRFGRERFHVVDSLFNFAFIYPYKKNIFEIYSSLPTHISSYFPTSNERTGIAYSYKIQNLIVGVTAGYLSFNHRGGGDGNMPIFDPNNFSYGAIIGLDI